MVFGRRSLLGGLVGSGGALVATAPAAATVTSSARLVRVRQVRAGDLVLGPGGRLVRVAARQALSTGRHRVTCTDPATGQSVPLDTEAEDTGFEGSRKIAVLMRDVPLGAVRFAEDPTTAIDGGTP